MKRLYGIAAAEGIAFGRAVLLDRRKIKTPRRHMLPEEIDQEIARFEAALEATDRQLQRIKEKLYQAGGQEHTLILQAHQLILKDEQLVEQTKEYIKKEQINAEWALRRTITGIKKLFDLVEDDYFKERRSDVDFVADHLMFTLVGKAQTELRPPPDSIIAAHGLSPADAVRFHRLGVKAFVTEVGGRTSHTSILARSFGIPTVVGLKELTDVVGTGDRLIVDGFRGEVLCEPDDETERRYNRRASRRAKTVQVLRKERELPAETLDGVRIHLHANIELSDEIPSALAQGAEGIGLYRTEFLFLGREDFPNEEDHFRDAMQVLAYSQNVPVTFRTCDLGVDKLPIKMSGNPESNPALGLRSIRLCLEQREIFKQQLRGILRAAVHGNMRIMFPMICGVEVFREAKLVVKECERELKSEGIDFSPVKMGAMIEMPSSAITSDLLAAEADFFAIGTNDLTQYALAIDRVNEQVNHLFKPYHPAILRLIRQVVQSGYHANIPVAVCGEMAGELLMTLLFLGLGVRQLSMNAGAIPDIKRLIRLSTIRDANNLAEQVFKQTTTSEVEALTQKTMDKLFPDGNFSSASDLEDDTLY